MSAISFNDDPGPRLNRNLARAMQEPQPGGKLREPDPGPSPVPDTQPTNVGVPDPGQVTQGKADSPVASGANAAASGSATAAADPASFANSVTQFFTDLNSNIPKVGSLDGLYFGGLLYLAWDLYKHRHMEAAVVVVALDIYLAYFRKVGATSTAQKG